MYRVETVVALGLWDALLACAPAVQPGLANAPALGTQPGTDAQVTDVIANGLDSCGRALDPGPLRYRVPPCPTASTARSAPALRTVAPSRHASEPLVTPWLEHYYMGWPCPHRRSVSDGERLLAWSPTDLRASHCAMP